MNNFLNQIIGQDKAKQILEAIISSKNIPHAFLFIGPEGVGKENTAVCFAKAVNSIPNNSNLDHKILASIQKLSEPYIKYVFPLPRGKNENDQSGPFEKLSNEEIEIVNEELTNKTENLFYKLKIPKANFIKISSIRDLKRFLSLNYEDIRYRVILISDAHLMNEESQNALLKNLEEPPEGVIFILTTSIPERLRETIKSRCWTINFQPLDNSVLKYVLEKNFNISNDLINQIVPFSNGSVTEALLLIESDFSELLEKIIRILRYSFGKKFHSALAEFQTIIEDSDSKDLILMIKLFIIWLNDLQKIRLDSSHKIYFESHKETLIKFNQKFPEVSIGDVIKKLDNLSIYNRNNININVAINNIIFQLASLT